jgi:glycosyltransferase involved in cell wall biosynthesis
MSKLAETAAYFARRFQVTRVLVIGDARGIRERLPAHIQVEHAPVSVMPTWGAAALKDALVVGFEPSTTVPAGEAATLAAWFAKASEAARAVIVWDKKIRYISREEGWRVDAKATTHAPFGLQLEFSLVDPQLPTSIPENPDITIRPILACFNEVDIIEACVQRMLDQDTRPIVLDNWSTDGTWEALKPFADAGKIELSRFPADGPSKHYEWRLILARKEEIAAQHPGSWIIHLDADEVRYGAFPGLTLKQNFWVAQTYGANAIDFTVVNFRPTDNDWARGKDPEKHFRYCEFGESRDDYTRQVKAWLSDGTRPSLSEQAGHEVRFPGRVLFPYKWLLKHYPLRSDTHARNKLNKDRMPRFSAAERTLGWHTHYDAVALQQTFLRSASTLLEFDASGSGALGAAFVTGIAPPKPGEQEEAPAPITQARVWLPYHTCLVLDLPADPADAFGRASVYTELSTLLAATFERVSVIATTPDAQAFGASIGLSSELLDLARFVDNTSAPASRAFALAQRLKEINPPFVIGLEAGGAMGAAVALKTQGLAFTDTRFVCVLAGGTQRRLRDSGLDLRTPIEFETDHFETLTATRADECLSVSESIAADWRSRGVASESLRVLPMRPRRHSAPEPAALPRRVDHIVVLGPQTGIDFESIATSLKALADVAPGIAITFVGPFGLAFGEHSGGHIVRAVKHLAITVNFVPYEGREKFLKTMAGSNLLVVLTRAGGWERLAANWLAAADIPCVVAAESAFAQEVGSSLVVCASPERDGLKQAISSILASGFQGSAGLPLTANSGDGEMSFWENWSSGLFGRHMTMFRRSSLAKGVSRKKKKSDLPLVTVGIPHFERVHHLLACIEGFQNQTYPNIEIIVVDDGSMKPETLIGLRSVAQMLEKGGGKLVVQKNAYLGAARNTAFAHARGDYVLFFDDDDFPVPDMVEKMVTAATARNADVVSANITFWESGALPETFEGIKSGSLFVGACIPLAYWRNPFGGAAVMVRRSAFVALGGYTTDHSVGWEDYEFSTRACLQGYVYENIPESLYLYRVNYQGMAATTPTLANGRRMWRLLEKHVGHPAMEAVLRATFMERMWQEDKTSKWSWLHTLGDRTPLYHKLSRTVFNSDEAIETLVRIAEVECDAELAARIRRTMIAREWAQPFTARQPTAPRRDHPFDSERVIESAMAMHKLGATPHAIEMLSSGLKENVGDTRRMLLSLAYLNSLTGRPDLTMDYAVRLISDYPDDPESVYAIYVATLALGDASMRRVAEAALYDCVKRDLLSRIPHLASLKTADANDVFEHWASHEAERGVKLVEFDVFPDGLTGRIQGMHQNWSILEPTFSEFLVESPDFGKWLPTEQGVFLHPPSDVGTPSLARLQLSGSSVISGIGASIQVLDARAEPIEAAIFLEQTNIATPLDAIYDALRTERETPGLTLAVPWTVFPRDGSEHTLRRLVPTGSPARSILVATRSSKIALNNWHALAYVRRLRVRHAA